MQQLTNREKQIIPYLIQDLRLKDIAYELDIAEKTISTHCEHIYKKYQVNTRIGLVLRLLSEKSDMTLLIESKEDIVLDPDA